MNRLERGLTAAVIGFPVAVIASKLGRIYLEQAWFAVLPFLAAAVLGVLGFEYMRRKDEMHQRILLEAAAFAVAVTFAVSLAWCCCKAGWRAAVFAFRHYRGGAAGRELVCRSGAVLATLPLTKKGALQRWQRPFFTISYRWT